MRKILDLEEAIVASRILRDQGKIIVLAGGCFDILHKGHLVFLKNAKKKGDVLFVLLESDRNVRRLKGEGRPVNNQKKRAKTLAQIPSIDFITLLPEMRLDEDYFELTRKLKPHIIAMTEEDMRAREKEAQAKSVGGNAVIVTKHFADYSTTKTLNNK